MNISKFKIVIKYIFGGTSAVVEYVLGVVNKALSSVDTSSKEKVQALLNTLLKANATLKAIAWLVPTKWQTAYGKTLDSIFSIVMMLEDLHRQLIDSTKFPFYTSEYYKVLPYIVELRNRGANKKENEIETCFNSLYGVMMLKLQKKDISPDTAHAVKEITTLIGMLNDYYFKDKSEGLEF